MNDGWHNMEWERPEDGALIQFASGKVGYVTDIPPETNAIGLKWRYTGIALEAGYGKPTRVEYGQSYPLSGLQESCAPDWTLSGMGG